MRYFKRFWEEATGEPLTNSWGTSIYYFETDEAGEVSRQVQLFENGKKLKYNQENLEDEFGGLSEVDLKLDEFAEFEIDQTEFEEIWNKDRYLSISMMH